MLHWLFYQAVLSLMLAGQGSVSAYVELQSGEQTAEVDLRGCPITYFGKEYQKLYVSYDSNELKICFDDRPEDGAKDCPIQHSTVPMVITKVAVNADTANKQAPGSPLHDALKGIVTAGQCAIVVRGKTPTGKNMFIMELHSFGKQAALRVKTESEYADEVKSKAQATLIVRSGDMSVKLPVVTGGSKKGPLDQYYDLSGCRNSDQVYEVGAILDLPDTCTTKVCQSTGDFTDDSIYMYCGSAEMCNNDGTCKPQHTLTAGDKKEVDISNCPITYYGKEYTKLFVSHDSTKMQLTVCFDAKAEDSAKDCATVASGDIDSIEVTPALSHFPRGSRLPKALKAFVTPGKCHMSLALKKGPTLYLTMELHNFGRQAALRATTEITYANSLSGDTVLEVSSGKVHKTYKVNSYIAPEDLYVDLTACRSGDDTHEVGSKEIEICNIKTCDATGVWTDDFKCGSADKCKDDGTCMPHTIGPEGEIEVDISWCPITYFGKKYEQLSVSHGDNEVRVCFDGPDCMIVHTGDIQGVDVTVVTEPTPLGSALHTALTGITTAGTCHVSVAVENEIPHLTMELHNFGQTAALRVKTGNTYVPIAADKAVLILLSGGTTLQYKINPAAKIEDNYYYLTACTAAVYDLQTCNMQTCDVPGNFIDHFLCGSPTKCKGDGKGNANQSPVKLCKALPPVATLKKNEHKEVDISNCPITYFGKTYDKLFVEHLSTKFKVCFDRHGGAGGMDCLSSRTGGSRVYIEVTVDGTESAPPSELTHIVTAGKCHTSLVFRTSSELYFTMELHNFDKQAAVIVKTEDDYHDALRGREAYLSVETEVMGKNALLEPDIAVYVDLTGCRDSGKGYALGTTDNTETCTTKTCSGGAEAVTSSPEYCGGTTCDATRTSYYKCAPKSIPGSGMQLDISGCPITYYGKEYKTVTVSLQLNDKLTVCFDAGADDCVVVTSAKLKAVEVFVHGGVPGACYILFQYVGQELTLDPMFTMKFNNRGKGAELQISSLNLGVFVEVKSGVIKEAKRLREQSSTVQETQDLTGCRHTDGKSYRGYLPRHGFEVPETCSIRYCTDTGDFTDSFKCKDRCNNNVCDPAQLQVKKADGRKEVDISKCPITYFGKTSNRLIVEIHSSGQLLLCIGDMGNCAYIDHLGENSLEITVVESGLPVGSPLHKALKGFVTAGQCHISVVLKGEVSNPSGPPTTHLTLTMELHSFGRRAVLWFRNEPMHARRLSDDAKLLLTAGSLSVEIDPFIKVTDVAQKQPVDKYYDLSGCRDSDGGAMEVTSKRFRDTCSTKTCGANGLITESFECASPAHCDLEFGMCKGPPTQTCTVIGSTVVSFFGESQAINTRCAYTLLKLEDGLVLMKQFIEVVAFFKDRRRKDVPLLSHVLVILEQEFPDKPKKETTVTLEQGRVKVGDDVVMNLGMKPYKVDKIELSKDKTGVTAKIPFKDQSILFFFDGTTLHIDIGEESRIIYESSIKGLCGANQPVDLSTMKDAIRSDDECENPENEVEDATIADNCNNMKAKCNLLTQHHFTVCNKAIPPQPYVTACEEVMCKYPAKDDLLCQLLEAYSWICRGQGIGGDGWRNSAGCSPTPRAFCSHLYCSPNEFCGERVNNKGDMGKACICRPIFYSQNLLDDLSDKTTVCEDKSDEKSASISIPRCVLEENHIDYSTLRLKEDGATCKGEYDHEDHMVTYSFNGGTCGTVTTKTADKKKILFKNAIVTPSSSGDGVISREGGVHIDFSCTAEETTEMSMAIGIKIKDSGVTEEITSGEWKYTLTMKAYTDAAHQKDITKDTEIPLAQRIWVSLTAEGLDDNAVAMVTDSCWATKEKAPDSTLKYELIKDGCSNTADGTVKVNGNGVGTSNYFSFNMFKFPGETSVYLHCKLKLCPKADNCVPDCGSGKRKRRSLVSNSEEMGPALITLAWTK